METTAIALIVLICTQNNLVCREDPHSMATYETVDQCKVELDSLIGRAPATGHRIVGKCVPLQKQPAEKEWAMNWAGEAVGFVERAPIRTAEIQPVGSATGSDSGEKAVQTAGLAVRASNGRESERVSMTINLISSVN